jgi:hypothetical protein
MIAETDESAAMSGVNLQLEQETLRPLIEQVVAEVLRHLEALLHCEAAND